MPVELNKFTLAGIGLIAKAQTVIEDYVKGYKEKEEGEVEVEEGEEKGEEKEVKTIREQFDNLVELGEEKYDEFTERVKKERERISEKLKERASDIITDLGLVTREDLEVLESKVERLQRMTRKISTQ